MKRVRVLVLERRRAATRSRRLIQRVQPDRGTDEPKQHPPERDPPRTVQRRLIHPIHPPLFPRPHRPRALRRGLFPRRGSRSHIANRPFAPGRTRSRFAAVSRQFERRIRRRVGRRRRRRRRRDARRLVSFRFQPSLERFDGSIVPVRSGGARTARTASLGPSRRRRGRVDADGGARDARARAGVGIRGGK